MIPLAESVVNVPLLFIVEPLWKVILPVDKFGATPIVKPLFAFTVKSEPLSNLIDSATSLLSVPLVTFKEPATCSYVLT